MDCTYSSSLHGTYPADTEYFKAIVDDRRDTFTTARALVSEISGNLTDVMASAIRFGGELKGLIAVNLDLTARRFVRGRDEVAGYVNVFLESLKGFFESLKGSVGETVSLAMKDIGSGMDEINRSVLNVSEIAVINKQSIERVKSGASRYRTGEPG